jgi:hypothetical protein
MTRVLLFFVIAVTGLLSATGVAAQSNASPPATCENDPIYDQFDFWLGTWEVFVGEQKAGENTITKEEGGCLVLEKWTDVAGGTGQSYNYYNPDTGKWRQVWVSSFMSIDYEGGLTEDGAMELIGNITYFHNSQTLKFLGRWSLQNDGSVRQHFEQFDEEKGEMVPIFTGIYHRKS